MQFLTLLSLLVLGLGSNSAFARESTPKEVVNGYIAIQEALAADNLTLAQTKAQQLQKEVQNFKSKEFKDLRTRLTPFIGSKSISDARKEFKNLSLIFVEWMQQNKDADLEVVYCPMAASKWIQKKGEVFNPYYGKEMLHCGEKTPL